MIGAIIAFVASYVLTVLTAPKPKGAKPANLSQAQIPVASEDQPIPVLFGTRLITGPNVTWYGDLRTTKIKADAGRKYGLFGPHKKITIGYRYYLGMHLILAAQIDAVTEIRVGGKTAWTGDVTANGQIVIDKPDLFGGDKSEGGVSGTIDVELGALAQDQNDYLAAHTGALTPAYRGVTGLVLRQVYLGTSLYLKPWAVRARRIADWYPAKADIDGDANPAHIIYELVTNADWGMGYAAQDVDDIAFRAAADTLYSESFGLSLLWTDQTSIEDFVTQVLQYVDGSLYVDLKSGLFVLRLARDDYDIASLPVLDESNILSVDNYARPAVGELTNQVSVVYEDRDTGNELTVTAQDVGLVRSQGAVVATTLQYPGIANGDLANRVAARELAQLSSALAKATITANRAAAALRIGDVFAWSWTPYGITLLPMRIVDIAYGTLGDGQIRIQAAQDVFGVQQAIYATPPATGWQAVSQPPAAAPVRRLIEATYRQIINEIAGADQWSQTEQTAGFVTVQATKPSSDALGYALADRVGSDPFKVIDDQDFTPTALLADDIGYLDTSLTMESGQDLALVDPPVLAYLADELVLVTAVTDTTATIQRGLLDTVPAPHAAGSRIWFFGAGQGIDSDNAWSDGQSVDVRVLPTTLQGPLELASAPTDSLSMAHRAIRPFAPGNLTINGERYPASTNVVPVVLAWSHRDRLQEVDQLVDTLQGGVGPEAGTTYIVRVYLDDVLQTTQKGLTGTTYSAAFSQGGEGRFEIDAVRDGYTSWQSLAATLEIIVLKIVGDAPPIDAGTAYSYTYTATGTAPYTWSIITGALPPGMQLNAATGEISGTSNTLGDYSWTVGVTDATGASAQLQDSASVVHLLFFDDFESGVLSGFEGDTSTLSIATAGAYQGSKFLQFGGSHTNNAWAKEFPAHNGPIKVEFAIKQIETAGGIQLALFSGYAGSITYPGNQPSYFIGFRAGDDTINLLKGAAAGQVTLDTANVALAFGQWYPGTLEINAGVITVNIAGITLSASDATYRSFNAWGGYSFRTGGVDVIAITDES